MGYYDNPPMINKNQGWDSVSAGILSASESIAKGILARGERKREEEKERKLTIQKLQDQKNKTDLFYNDKMSDWSKSHTKVGGGVDEQINTILQQKIQLAADSQIALLNETDPKIRQSYLKNIRDADGFMNNAANASKAIAMDTATWREGASAISVGVPGGWAINGNPEQIKSRRSALEIMGGLDGLYENTNMSVEEDGTGAGFNIKISGRHKGEGADFEPITINSDSYLKADAAGTGGFLSKVESLDDFYKASKKTIVDDKGKILPGYLSGTFETVDLPSKGNTGGTVKDTWQIQGGQRLETDALRTQIKSSAEIKAAAYLKADKEQSLRTLLDYTLEMQPGYYDETFKNLGGPETQKAELTRLLTDSSFNKFTADLHKTQESGQTVYWGPDSKVGQKDKPSATELRGDKEDKQPPTTYQEDYYKDIISGYRLKPGEKKDGKVAYKTRSILVDNLNKLSGKQDKFITREELLKMYKNSPYKSGNFDTGLTLQEAYEKGKIKVKPEESFVSSFGKGYVYSKEGEGTYKAVKYNVDSAADRVKLALDQTADAGEKKMLQSKLKDASISDWLTNNPQKPGESEQAYINRARKNN